ncbi:MAG: hypothetical protein Phog2KO_41170 [Phototrophicaceae bacterium]
MRKTLLSTTLTTLLLLLSVTVILAQDACDAFVDRALEAVDTHCSTVGRNQACYGFNRVEAGFQTDMPADFFNQPSDVTEIAMIETIRTAPFSLDGDQWGVAVMVLQANLPETLPGQNVTFILMGDAEVENAVTPENAYDPIIGIDVTVTYPQGAAIRSGAGDNFNTIGGVAVGTIFNTDGLSEDGNWLRIVYQERPAWIRRTVVDPIPEIETLPILNSDLQTPMQAFYLRTGIGQPSCNEVPDNSLLVQGPEDIEIALTVNGANIELGSSGILRVIELNGEPQLEIVVLDGEFVVKADEFNPQDVVIRAGQRTRLCLQDGNNIGVDGEANDLVVSCGASQPEQVDATNFGDDWCKLETLPENLLNYPLTTCYDRIHTIQAGENLFRIAQFYCVTIDDLSAVNGITDPSQISVGQILVLPPTACDGSGTTRPPVTVSNPTDEDNDAPTCTLSLISPLGNVNSGNHTFSWTATAGEGISYGLVFFNYEGLQMETFFTSDTSYFLNLGQQTSTGGEFSWEVRAYQNDSELCRSSRSPQLVRTGELDVPSDNPVVRATTVPTAVPTPIPLVMSVTCTSPLGYDIEGEVTWSNLPAGESITLEVNSSFSTASGGPYTASSGVEAVTLTDYPPGTVYATASTGLVVSASC